MKDNEFADYIFTNEYALKLVQNLPPELRKLLNMRRFIPPAGYISPNLIAGSFSHHIAEVLLKMNRDEAVVGAYANLFSLGCWHAYHGWPMFAVTEELLQAMLLTDPPEDIKWSELQWPLPAATFLLPNTEQIRRELHTSKPLAISVGRLSKPQSPHAQVALDHLLNRVRMPDNSVRSMVSIYYYDDTAKAPMWHDVTAKPEWSLGYSISKDVHRDETDELRWSDVDFERMGRAVKLAANFLCFMASTYQPLAMEGGGNGDQPLRKAQTKRNKERDALYGVRWLGQGYRLKKHPLGGHHSSPRDHWRRGHYRSQPHGPARALRRPIWIEPTWVGE